MTMTSRSATALVEGHAVLVLHVAAKNVQSTADGEMDPALAGFLHGLAYLALVLWDIVVANFEVAWIILFKRNRDLKSAWLVIPIELDTPEAITAP